MDDIVRECLVCSKRFWSPTYTGEYCSGCRKAGGPRLPGGPIDATFTKAAVGFDKNGNPFARLSQSPDYKPVDPGADLHVGGGDLDLMDIPDGFVFVELDADGKEVPPKVHEHPPRLLRNGSVKEFFHKIILDASIGPSEYRNNYEAAEALLKKRIARQVEDEFGPGHNSYETRVQIRRDGELMQNQVEVTVSARYRI